VLRVKKEIVSSYDTNEGCQGCRAGCLDAGKPEVDLVRISLQREVKRKGGPDGYTSLSKHGGGVYYLCGECFLELGKGLFPAALGAFLVDADLVMAGEEKGEGDA